MNATQVWDNLVAYTLQVGLLVGLGAIIPVTLRPLRTPRARLLFWQVLLLTCVALPWVRPWRQEVVNTAVQVSTAFTAATSTSIPELAPVGRPLPFREIALWFLAAGVIVRLGLLGVGLARLTAYRRRGRELPADMPIADVTLLISDDVAGPVTFGWLKPVVLLPSRFPSLTAEMQDAILRHELMHIERRDWLFTIAEELVRAVLWFHPAIWWVIGEIQLAREQAVDRAVIENTRAREPYLDALLLMAGAPISSSGASDLAPAPMFLRRRHLKKRVMEAMREVRMATVSKTRLVCVLGAAVAMVAAACWLATGAFPLSAAPQVVTDAPGVLVSMNGLPLLHRSAVTYPASALAKGVEGTVVVQVRLDAKGEVVDAAVLSGPDELRKAAQQSVLTWHFDKSVASSTQVVNIDFRKPATAANAQPDKVLFDRAMNSLEHGNYETARLSLNTLINTYGSSEYLARAKIAIIDSWLREGGPQGLAQGAAEYNDFLLFYPNMKETAESQLGPRLRLLERKTAANAAVLAAPSAPLPPPPPTSGKLSRIVVTGLSDSARDELLSRLPVREGDEWSFQMLAAAGKAATAFDPHLVTVLTQPTLGELELQISPRSISEPVFRSTLGSGATTTSTVTLAPTAVPPNVYRVGNGVSQPAVLSKVDPQFPEEAGTDASGGTVLLSCVIGADGKAQDIQIKRSLGAGFDANAIKAVSQWVFRPGMSNGVPVNVRAQIEVNFRR